MKKPDYLKPNGHIYFIAPSFGCNIEPYYTRLKKVIEIFKSLGYKITVGENCFSGIGIASATPEKRAAEFMDAYLSDADIIISVGGGELMIEILPYINFNYLKSLPPKWFLGYSDNTILTYTLATLSDVMSIYGINAGDFRTFPFILDAKDTYDFFTGKKKKFEPYLKWELDDKSDDPLFQYNLTEANSTRLIHKDFRQIEGRMLGGCLDVLVALCGTPYDGTIDFAEKYSDEGIIFFFESCDLNPLQVLRALIQLENSGWFKYVKCFIIGRPYTYNEISYGMNHNDAILYVLKKYDVPIIMDFDFGHLKPIIPMVTGSSAKLIKSDDKISIEYKKN